MSDFSREDRRGQIDLVSDRDIILESDRDMDGAGDIVFRTGGVERGRVNYAGVGSGVFGGLLPVFNVKDSPYGAVGNGTFDDTGAIVAAIAAAAIVSGIVFFPYGTYKTTSVVTIPSNVTLLGVRAGSVIKPVTALNTTTMFVSTGKLRGATNTLAGDVAIGATSITLSGGHVDSPVAGDYVMLTDSTTPFAHTQIMRVLSAADPVYTLEEPVLNAFAAATSVVQMLLPTGDGTTTFPGSVNVEVRDLTFDMSAMTGLNGAALGFTNAERPVIRNVTFKNGAVNASAGNPQIGGAGLALTNCIEPVVDNVLFEMCGTTGIAALAPANCTGGRFSNIELHHGGFHIQLSSCVKGVWSNIVSRAAGWQTNGGRGIKLQTCTAFTSWSNVSVHRPHSNCFGFVQGSHHNFVAPLITVGGLVQDGVWGEGELSHHNIVHVISRYNATFDLGLYAGTDTYNYYAGDFDPAKVSYSGGADSTNKSVSLTDGQTIPAVTAAATIAIPFSSDIVQINGATGIASITATRPGHRITLIFASTPTVTDGSNLKLAGNFVATADDTLSLVCDGTNWIEVCRSVN